MSKKLRLVRKRKQRPEGVEQVLAPIRIVSDWEERISMFLQEAIENPEREAQICEELIGYVQYLVRSDRNAYRQRCLDIVLKVFNRERRKFEPRVLTVRGGEEEGSR